MRKLKASSWQLTPGAGYVVSVPAEATVSIIDNDPAPTLCDQQHECAGKRLRGLHDLAAASERKDVSVDFATSAGTAATGLICGFGADFLGRSGTRTFTPGQTALSVSVPTCADAIADPGETFVVRLSNPRLATFATAGASTGTATILETKTGTFELDPAEAVVDVQQRVQYQADLERAAAAQLARSANCRSAHPRRSGPRGLGAILRDEQHDGTVRSGDRHVWAGRVSGRTGPAGESIRRASHEGIRGRRQRSDRTVGDADTRRELQACRSRSRLCRGSCGHGRQRRSRALCESRLR